MDEVLRMTYASSLTGLCENNSSFDAGTLRICYTGKNQNHSNLSKEVIERAIPSIYNCPIVCHYDRESDSLGGHDVEIVTGDDGLPKMVNATSPVGVIPESANVWFEDYEEEDGTVHEYLYADVLLWKRQEAYQKIKKDGVTAQSMEIKVKSGELVDGVYDINDFEFTAFTLIGVEPCFESAALEFSMNDFKKELSEMMLDLKRSFTKVNPSTEDDNTYLHDYSMEGGEKVLDEKKKLIADYGFNLEELGFSIDDLTLDELTEKLNGMKEKAPEGGNQFALVSNITDELRRALADGEKITYDWDDDDEYAYPRYSYVDCDLDANEVYCWDRKDWSLCGFSFSINGDAVAVDYETKKRKKYVIDDFDEGDDSDQSTPIAEVFNALDEILAARADIEEKFNAASITITTMEAELVELRQFKKDISEATAKNERTELFSHFVDLSGIEAFENLKEHCMDYALDILEEKCYAIRGRNNKVEVKFSADNSTPKLMVTPENNVFGAGESTDEPYGGIVQKYIKKI